MIQIHVCQFNGRKKGLLHQARVLKFFLILLNLLINHPTKSLENHLLFPLAGNSHSWRICLVSKRLHGRAGYLCVTCRVFSCQWSTAGQQRKCCFCCFSMAVPQQCTQIHLAWGLPCPQGSDWWALIALGVKCFWLTRFGLCQVCVMQGQTGLCK